MRKKGVAIGSVITMAAGLLCFLSTASAGVNNNSRYVLLYPNGKEVSIEKVLGNEANGAVYTPLPNYILINNWDGKKFRKFNEKYGNLGKSSIFGSKGYFGSVGYTSGEIAEIELCNGFCKIYDTKNNKFVKFLSPRLSFEVGALILDKYDKGDKNLATQVIGKIYSNYLDQKIMEGSSGNPSGSSSTTSSSSLSSSSSASSTSSSSSSSGSSSRGGGGVGSDF